MYFIKNCVILYNMSTWFRRQKSRKGFTLIELIVVLAIVSMMSGVVLFNYNASKKTNELNTFAYDIAGVFRIAQNGGRNASGGDFETGNTDVYSYYIQKGFPSYGVRIEADSQGVISRIFLYKSGLGINTYVGFDNTDTILETYNTSSSKLPVGYQIKICASVDYTNTTNPCTPYGVNTWVEFSRLTSELQIDSLFSASLGTKSPTIMISSLQGGTSLFRYIVLERSGNVFVR